MAIDQLLSAHARERAAARAGRLARRLVLVGGALVALALFLERAGVDVPLLRLPGLPPAGGVERVFHFVAVSIAGLVQGVALLVALFLLAAAVRFVAPLLLRPPLADVARAADRALETDRFCAALEARGPLAPRVEREALERPPPADLFRLRRARAGSRWLRRAVVALVLLVALMPGRAPAEEGGPLSMPPEGGTEEHPLVLRLVGERDVFAPGRPVPVYVILEATRAPLVDLTLAATLAIDDGAAMPTGATLFVPAGAPGQDAAALDLRAYVADLAPGDHVAVAYAGELESNPYRFRIEPPPDGESENPESEPPPTPPPPAPGAGGGPEETKPKYVEPLVRGDDQVRKKAKVPIEVPEGGGGQQERPLDEAWPELERRREEALNRPGLSPAARKLVREYFERLRPEGR